VRDNEGVTDAPSPLLSLPGAVAGDGIDAAVAAHYGSFNGEQRTLVGGDGFVDLSHRGVVRVSGPDRLAWLHSRGEVLEQCVHGDEIELSIRLSPENWARFQASESA